MSILNCLRHHISHAVCMIMNCHYQVSHHPPVSAFHAESQDWVFWQEYKLDTKFRGQVYLKHNLYYLILPNCIIIKLTIKFGNKVNDIHKGKHRWRNTSGVTRLDNSVCVGGGGVVSYIRFHKSISNYMCVHVVPLSS